MSGNKFKIGDRVRLERPSKYDTMKELKYGATGRVLEDDDIPCIEWDNWTNGHNGGCPLIENSSWAVDEDKIEIDA